LNSRFNVQQPVGFLVMQVRMVERTSDNIANSGGQHQSSIWVTHIVPGDI
jgi:hypothetical protein